MNLLELANGVLGEGEGHIEGDLIESIPLESNSPDAHYKALQWTRSAYEAIQRRKADYKFHWQDGVLITTSGETASYTKAGIRKVNEDSILCQRDGDTVLTEMQWIEWQEYRNRFRLVQNQLGPSTPYWITRAPDNTFKILPKPVGTSVYTITAEWYRTNHKLVKETDEPLWDEEFHRIIILEALISYMEEYDVASLKSRLNNELPNLKQEFYNRYLPDWSC